MKIKFVRNHKQYKKGTEIIVSNRRALHYVKHGLAVKVEVEIKEVAPLEKAEEKKVKKQKDK